MPLRACPPDGTLLSHRRQFAPNRTPLRCVSPYGRRRRTLSCRVAGSRARTIVRGYLGRWALVSAVIPIHREQDGVWSADLADLPDLADFQVHALSRPAA